MSWCRKVVVFIPGCLLCPGLQAGDSENNRLWPEAFRTIWERYPVDVVQMACPEATFPNGLAGLGRTPHGVQYYEKLEGFSSHCSRLALETANHLISFLHAKYAVAAVVGIEHSPTCAVGYMYTRQGTIRRPGLYFGVLMDLLSTAGLDITFIGVNRRFPRKAVIELERAILTAGGDFFSESGVQHDAKGT